jgi:Fe-S cluster assembly iron-binding protein IscA
VKPAENKYVPPAPPQETVKPVEAERAKQAAVPTPKTVEPPKMPVHYNEITVKLTKGDFTLTPAAVEKLSASSQPSAGGEPRVLRITRLPGTPVQLRMFVDKQGPNDIGVLNNDLRILFLSPEAAEMLGGIVIDYQTTGTGGEFALSKKKTV